MFRHCSSLTFSSSRGAWMLSSMGCGGGGCSGAGCFGGGSGSFAAGFSSSTPGMALRGATASGGPSSFRTVRRAFSGMLAMSLV